jgi:hypothetical protein
MIIYIGGIPKEYSGTFNTDGKDIHREDGPAIIYADSSKFWWNHGKRHREDGPAVEYPNGTKQWWVNGELHREDGPAIENPNGDRYWYINGKRHREDGPAVMTADHNEWWLNGKKYFLTDFLKQLPEEEAILVALEWK